MNFCGGFLAVLFLALLNLNCGQIINEEKLERQLKMTD